LIKNFLSILGFVFGGEASALRALFFGLGFRVAKAQRSGEFPKQAEVIFLVPIQLSQAKLEL
jgi:hypothetical protein